MFIYNAVLAFNSWIWGIPILIILIGGGLYLSFITGFVQIRHFPTIIKSTVGSMFNKEEMKEETGLDFSPLTPDTLYERPFFTSVGMTDECCATVYGYASGQISREGLEDTEDLEVVLADREEVRRILKEERVAIMCAYMLMHFLKEEEPFGFLQL